MRIVVQLAAKLVCIRSSRIRQMRSGRFTSSSEFWFFVRKRAPLRIRQGSGIIVAQILQQPNVHSLAEKLPSNDGQLAQVKGFSVFYFGVADKSFLESIAP